LGSQEGGHWEVNLGLKETDEPPAAAGKELRQRMKEAKASGDVTGNVQQRCEFFKHRGHEFRRTLRKAGTASGGCQSPGNGV
jgi:uncharacterized protein YmfQ (DUF2313 family)